MHCPILSPLLLYPFKKSFIKDMRSTDGSVIKNEPPHGSEYQSNSCKSHVDRYVKCRAVMFIIPRIFDAYDSCEGR